MLLRDLLNVMSGVEGQHIRVAAPPSVGSSITIGGTAVPSSSSSGVGEVKVSEVTLMIDVDSADRSTVSQVSPLPLIVLYLWCAPGSRL